MGEVDPADGGRKEGLAERAGREKVAALVAWVCVVLAAREKTGGGIKKKNEALFCVINGICEFFFSSNFMMRLKRPICETHVLLFHQNIEIGGNFMSCSS
jgi:hypothetical protein